MSQTTCGGDRNRFNRRAALATMGAGFGLAFGAAPAHGHAKRAPVRPEDEGFMRLAIAEAAKGDFPFGAVIVRDGKVVATGRNLGVTNNDPTAHGEMVAIRRFRKSFIRASANSSTRDMKFNRVRPATIAAKGTMEVTAVRRCQAGSPLTRRRA